MNRSKTKSKSQINSIPESLSNELVLDNELDFTESALYLTKFLLKVLEKVVTNTSSLCKFNVSQMFSANLSASSSSTLLRDYQINTHRDLNHIQHLLANYLLFLMFIMNAGSFPKMAYAFSSLVNNKSSSGTNRTKRSKSKNNLKIIQY